jgi:hypothetical protein
MGKYVPHLEFLDVLLSDEAVLSPDISFYQRLLARDQDEATELVIARLNISDGKCVYDELFIPALTFTKRDLERDDLSESDVRFVCESTAEILEDLGERHGIVSADVSADASNRTERMDVADAQQEAKTHLLACPARDQFDRLGITMLCQLLDPRQWEVEITPIENIASKLEQQLADKVPLVVCIAAVPPGGLAHTRFLCKRLRQRFPSLTIIVGRWGLNENLESNSQQFQDAGAVVMSATLLETLSQLTGMRSSILANNEQPRDGHPGLRIDELQPEFRPRSQHDTFKSIVP